MRNKSSRPLWVRLTLTMAGLLLGTIVVVWLLNTFFLGRFAAWIKEGRMVEAFRTLAAAEGDYSSAEFDVTFDRLCQKGNLTILVAGADGRIIKSSASNNEELWQQFLNAVFLADQGEQGMVTIRSTDEYRLLRQSDHRLSSEYITLWGTLPDGNLALVRTAVEGIRDAAKSSNLFLLFTGLSATVLSVVLIYVLCRRMVQPIASLSEIARRMADLDFEAKYDVQGIREVDELGESMNRLSETLLHTIEDLKTANNELMLDNQRKAEIDEMRRGFLSDVSHELKTPLALILGYAEGLKDGVAEDPESLAFYCDVICDETQKMSRMVRELLDLTHLESGGVKASLSRFDVAELIRGVVAHNSLLSDQEGIAVEFSDPGSCYVWSDEQRVEEVVTNYLSNAIHHCEESGEPPRKVIRIMLEGRGEKTVLRVFNSGKGIDPEEMGKLWIKFYKGDKARTRRFGGSGVGLSIVRALAELLHEECGAVNVDGGVEFFFSLSNC